MSNPRITLLLLLATMSASAIVSPGIVLCFEADGTSHFELGGEACCGSPDDGGGSTETGATAATTPSDCDGCTDVAFGDALSLSARARLPLSVPPLAAAPVAPFAMPVDPAQACGARYDIPYARPPADAGGFDCLVLNC